jgi:hypothetical protein
MVKLLIFLEKSGSSVSKKLISAPVCPKRNDKYRIHSPRKIIAFFLFQNIGTEVSKTYTTSHGSGKYIKWSPVGKKTLGNVHIFLYFVN